MCNIVVLKSDGSKKRCERDDNSILSSGETLLYNACVQALQTYGVSKKARFRFRPLVNNV